MACVKRFMAVAHARNQACSGTFDTKVQQSIDAITHQSLNLSKSDQGIRLRVQTSARVAAKVSKRCMDALEVQRKEKRVMYGFCILDVC